MLAVESLISEIVRLGGTMNQPSASECISEAEARIGCVIPSDFKAFYLAANGTSSDTDHWSWHFFAINEIQNLCSYRNPDYLLKLDTQSIAGNKLFTFCDVLIDAPTYAVVGDPAREDYGSVYADDTSEGWFVAGSFAEFVNVFMAKNDDILLMPDA